MKTINKHIRIYLAGSRSNPQSFVDAVRDLRLQGFEEIHNPTSDLCQLDTDIPRDKAHGCAQLLTAWAQLVVTLGGWTSDVGACAEVALANWAQIPIYTLTELTDTPSYDEKVERYTAIRKSDPYISQKEAWLRAALKPVVDFKGGGRLYEESLRASMFGCANCGHHPVATGWYIGKDCRHYCSRSCAVVFEGEGI